MPYRAPGLGDDRVDWILVEIHKAQSTLDARIAEAQALPDTDLDKAQRISRLNAMKREVDSAFIDLESQISLWASGDITSFYRQGHATASTQLATGYTFTLPHREALDLISRDAYDDVATRLLQVRSGFSANVELQKMYERLDPSQVTAIQAQGRSAVAQLLLTGEDPRKISKRLAQDLWSQGIQITDAGGRTWNPEAYTRMLVRTKSANAYNAGSMNKYAEEGVSRVQVFDGVEDDPECAEANGEIWSLEYAMQNVIQHPNCRRAFGPVPGEGPVDRKSVQPLSVIFDRLESVALGVTALRSFQRTGEINISATLARLVTEFLEIQAGVGLPLVDSFVMGALGQGFRNADAWFEAFIDPILYSAGLIDDFPTRAQLVRASVKEGGFNAFMKSLEESVARGAARIPGGSAQVRAVSDQIGRLSDEAVGIVNEVVAKASDSDGVLRYVDFVANQLNVNRLGKITGETLLMVKRGEADNLKEAWGAARDYLEQLARLREEHIRVVTATYEDAVEAAQRIGEARRAILRLLELEGLAPVTFPAEVEELIRNYRVVEGLAVPLSRRHLLELYEELTEVHASAFRRAQETKDLLKHHDVKALPFPAAIGPDFPSEAGSYWDILEFQDDAATVRNALIDMEFVPAFNLDVFREGGEALEKLVRHPDAKGVLIDQILDFRSESLAARNFHTQLSEVTKSRLIERGALKTSEDSLEFLDAEKLLEFIIEHLRTIEFDGQTVSVLGRNLADDPDDLQVIEDVFFLATGLFRQVDLLEGTFPTVFEPLMKRVAGDANKINVLWQNSLRHYRDSPRRLWEVDPVYPQTYIKALSLAFPGQVTRITGGINGDQAIVRLPNGRSIFVKAYPNGGLLPGGESLASQTLTSYVASQIGDLEVPPTEVWSSGKGRVWGTLHPALTDSVQYGESPLVIRSDQARRHAFLDALTAERDGHGGNYMVHEYNETVFSIDNEAGWFHDLESKWRQGVPFQARSSELGEAWNELDDITINGMEPPVRLIRLTEDETNFILGSGRRTAAPGLIRYNDVPIIQDYGGDYYLVAGRTGVVNVDGDDAWDAAFFLTESELEFVLKTEDMLFDEFYDELSDVWGEFPDEVKDELVSSLAASDFDEVISEWAGTAAANLRRRLDSYIEGGLFNTAGGVTEYVNRRGFRAVVGEPVSYKTIPDGRENFGTVVNIFEDLDGDLKAHIAVGVGFKQSASQLPSTRLRLDTITLDLVQPSNQIPEASYRIDLTERLRRINTVREESMHGIVYETDEAGILREARRQHISIENQTNSEITFYYRMGNGGPVTNGRIPDEVVVKMNKIIEEAIEELPFYERPLRVIVSPKPLRTSDGRKAFGLFDVEERVVHVSATGLFPDLIADDKGRLVFDSIDALNDAVDLNAFERVMRHELGHAQAVGREIRTRVELSEVIIEQILDDFPNFASVEDFEVFARDALIKHGRPDLVDSGTTNLRSLVEFRVSVIEDIINSNQVAAARSLAEDGLPNEISPEIVHALLRGDPEAHQELLAEILGSGQDPILWARDRNVDFDSLTQLVFRNRRVPNEEEWYGPKFAAFVEKQLSDEAVLVPLNRNNRQYWKESELNSKYLIQRAREPDGGFTYQIVTEAEPPQGWAVAIEENQLIIENFSEMSNKEFKDVLENYAAQHRGLLDQPDWYLGGWHDTANNTFYLDTSKVLPDEVSAAAFGFQERQLAIFNLQTFDTKPVLSKYSSLTDYLDAEVPKFRQLREDVIDVLSPKTKTRHSYEVDVAGRRPIFSLSSFDEESVTKFYEALDRRTIVVKETGLEVLSTPEAMRESYIDILQRAATEYKKNPGLRAEHRFYEIWNSGFRETASETNISMARIAGGAAAMSPNLDADLNFQYAIYFARKLGSDEPLTQADVLLLKKYYRQISSNYAEYASQTDKPALIKSKLDASRRYRDWANQLRVGMRLSEMDSEQATRTLYAFYKEENGKGFTVPTTFRNYEKALQVMRGELEIIDALGDSKVRSFYNNIVDLEDVLGVQDVTIDFHMIDSALRINSEQGKTIKGVDPKIDGIALGLRIILAQVVRDLWNEGFGQAVNARSPAELQEVIWAVWRLGKDEGWWGEIPLAVERVTKA